MEKERKTNVSKYLIDQVAMMFLRHPGQAYSRADIQNMLGVSKPTACRIVTELSRRIRLEEKKEGHQVYYMLSEDEREKIYQSLDFILAVSDRERLLNSGSSSNIFGSSIDDLSRKLQKAGLVSFSSSQIREKIGTPQKLDKDNVNYVDTLLTALETSTKIDITYKGAFSDCVKEHELWPVGLYIRNGNLYLYAYDPEHKGATSYAYSRMRTVALRYDEHYSIPVGISMDDCISDPFGVATAEPRRVRVHIFNKQAFFEKEKIWPKGSVLTECEDGSIILELTIVDPSAFHAWALCSTRGLLMKNEYAAIMDKFVSAYGRESFDSFAHFAGMKGRQYDKQDRLRLMLVGRSTNGWPSVSEGIDSRSFGKRMGDSFLDRDHAAFDWIQNVPSRPGVFTNGEEYSLGRSDFWNYTGELWRQLTA